MKNSYLLSPLNAFKLLLLVCFSIFTNCVHAQNVKKDTTKLGASDCQCYNFRNTGTFSQASQVDVQIDMPNISGGRLYMPGSKNAMFIGFGDGTALNKFKSISSSTLLNWSLWVEKGIVAKNYAITDPSNWADFVFDDNYKLRPIREVEEYVKINKHLPDFPSERELKRKGYTVQDMNVLFMQKIEELTLYTIQQDKQLRLQQNLINNMSLELKQARQFLDEIMKKIK